MCICFCMHVYCYERKCDRRYRVVFLQSISRPIILHVSHHFSVRWSDIPLAKKNARGSPYLCCPYLSSYLSSRSTFLSSRIVSHTFHNIYFLTFILKSSSFVLWKVGDTNRDDEKMYRDERHDERCGRENRDDWRSHFIMTTRISKKEVVCYDGGVVESGEMIMWVYRDREIAYLGLI